MHKLDAQTVQSITESKLSNTAKIVMLRLSCEANQAKPHVFIDVKKLSEALGKSASTIRRAIQELVKQGRLVFDGLVVSLKYKVYQIVFDLTASVKRAVRKVVPVRSEEPPQPQAKQEVEVKESFVVLPPALEPELEEMAQHLLGFGLQKEFVESLVKGKSKKECEDLALRFLENLTSGEKLPARQWFEQEACLGGSLSWKAAYDQARAVILRQQA